MENRFKVPIVIFTFRRLDTVKLLIEKLKDIEPSVLYLFSDAARKNVEHEADKVQEVRDYLSNAITWDCDKHYHFAKSNKGCDASIRTGLDIVFSEQKSAIVFEDDTIPNLSFFRYCEALLDYYEMDNRIQFIGGFNAIGQSNIIKADYTYGKTVPMSGAFATWANRWNECDFALSDWPINKQMKKFHSCYFSKEMRQIAVREFDEAYDNIIAAWDVRFQYDLMNKDRLAIAPKGNLATNRSDVEGAFHALGKKQAKRFLDIMSVSDVVLSDPLIHPEKVTRDEAYDKERQKRMLAVNGNYCFRKIYGVYRRIKDWFYAHLPQNVWKFIVRLIKR